MTTKDPNLIKTPIDATDHDHSDKASANKIEKDIIAKDTIENTKGLETFEEGVVDTKHVNDGDNPARQPDRRDQEGTAFDDGVNAEEQQTTSEPQSEEINEINRYASIDNAQTRTLTPDERHPES